MGFYDPQHRKKRCVLSRELVFKALLQIITQVQKDLHSTKNFCSTLHGRGHSC
jgi:hypothetical protein